MRTLVVLQARLGSTRLPGKALLHLGGRPVVVLAAQRARRTGLEVVVATSEEPDDDAVHREVTAAGVPCFRGPLEDPLGRFAAAAAHAGLAPGDVVVRLTADNVVPDGELVEELVRALPADGYVRLDDRLPHGLSAEAFTAGLLADAAARATTSYDREHVTPWIRRATADTTHLPRTVPAGGPDLRCTIDTLGDFVVAERALAGVDDPVGAPWSLLLERWVGAAALRARRPSRRPNAIGQGEWVLGTVQLGLPYGVANRTGLPGDAAAARLLEAAAAAGATHVDTARAYGDSERRVGRSLARGLPRDLGVVTKVAPLDDVAEEASDTAVELSVERSLRALGRSAVDALLLHRWADWCRRGGAVADTVCRLQEQGVARVVGASLSTPDELREALADPRVGYVQLPFNFLDRRWLDDEVQERLASRPDVVVTVRSVFLQGLLAAPDHAAWPSASAVDPDAVRAAVGALVHELGRASPADLALAYVRAHPFVTSVVLGAETSEQVDDQAELLDRPPLVGDEIDLVHARVPAGDAVLVDPSRWR